MGTFYKGNNILNDRILDNYLKGIYIDPKGNKEIISNKINKYNVETIKHVKELNCQWYPLIMLEQIAIKLMKLNSDSSSYECRNVFNLIQSQSGTIRYNRLFISTLKKYAIDKQKVYDSINKAIGKQEERLDRNEKLIMTMLKDYGLGDIIELVEKSNNMSIKEHIYLFLEEQEESIDVIFNVDNKEDKVKYYDKLTDSYISYISNLAEKNGISLNNDLSQSILEHRQLINDRIQKQKEENKERKLNNKQTSAYNAIQNRGSILQRDMMSGCFDDKLLLDENRSYRLFKRVSDLGGTAWFIGASRGQRVTYVGKDNKKTDDFNKMLLLKNKADADKVIANIKADTRHELSTANLLSQRLTTITNYDGIGTVSNLESRTKGMIDALEIELNSIDSASGYSQAVRDMLLRNQGIQIEIATLKAVVYVASDLETNDLKFVGINKGNIGIAKHKCNTAIFSLEEVNRNNITQVIETSLPGYKIVRHNINLDSKIFNKKLQLAKFEETLVNMAAQGKYTQGLAYSVRCGKNKDITLDVSKHLVERYSNVRVGKFKARIDQYKESGYTEVYLIYDTSDGGKFYADHLDSRRTQSLSMAYIFTDLDSAINAAKLLYSTISSEINIIRILTVKIK